MQDAGLKTLGRYRLEAVLGQGGMGIVYRGRDPLRDAPVALKAIRPDLLSSRERDNVIARFQREAAITRLLDNPGIVRVYDFDQAGDFYFLVLEFVPGKELAQLLDGGMPLAPDRVVTLMVQILSALGHAHRHGIVHRDVKPANVMVLDDLRTKLMDFGIAREEASDATLSSGVVGTPSYMAPEQLMGRKVDGRADLFSAGVLLYQLLTGVKPFTGNLTQVMCAILQADPPPPSQVSRRAPPQFDAVAAAALAKDPDRRIPTAEQFIERLLEAQERWRTAQTTAVAAGGADDDRTLAFDPDATRAAADGLSLTQSAHEIEALLARALADQVDAELVARLEAALAALADPAALHDPRAPAIRASLAARLVDEVVPRLEALIIAEAPLPGRAELGSRADWSELIDLFLVLRNGLPALGRAEAQGRLGQAVIRELSQAHLLYANEINRSLMGEDHPDLLAISMNFLRLDILQWALERLNAHAEAANIKMTTRMLAGQVMRKVNDLTREVLARDDEFLRFDVANILVSIEELIVLVSRLMEQDNDVSSAFLLAAGRQIVVEFIGNARRLIAITLDELCEEADSPQPDVGLFSAKLEQVGYLYLFAVRLEGLEIDASLAALAQEARSGMDRLSAAVRARYADPAQPGALREAMAEMMTALYAFAESVGWTGYCESLLGFLSRRL